MPRAKTEETTELRERIIALRGQLERAHEMHRELEAALKDEEYKRLALETRYLHLQRLCRRLSETLKELADV